MIKGILIFFSFLLLTTSQDISCSLNPTGVTSGTYGSNSVIPEITVDNKGRILFIKNISFSSNPVSETNLKNVKNYGAVGDGITDDTLAIQSAIDNEVGIWFPPGNYIITNTIKIWRRNGFRLIGSGFGSVAEQRQSRITWNGSPNKTMLLIYSSASCEIANIAIEGTPTTFPGRGIFVTALNSHGASHWNLIHDVSIGYIHGYPGYGLVVGSETDDDISNNNFQRILLVFNNYDLVQLGIQTAANYYERLISLLFKNYGVWHIAGTMTIDNCNIFGSETATDDIRIESTALEFITRGNYHELLYARTTARAYHFVSGTRFWNTAVINARILTVLDAGGAVNPDIFRYDQQGDLDFHGCTFNGLTAGTIYIRNNALSEPKSLTMYGNHYFSAMSEDIQGNWNYQSVTRTILRDTNGIISLQNSAAVQSLFSKSFTLQGNTNYRVEGEIFVARSVGTNAHQIGMSEGGTCSIVLRRMTYVASSATSLYGMATPFVSSTQIGSTQWITPSTNSPAYTTIIIKGELRTLTSGTWIPQIQWSVAPGGQPTLQPGSFIKLTPIASLSTWNIN